MKTWRLVANLVVFGVVALALIAYGVVDLLGDPFSKTTTVSAVFPDASGIYTNFTVWLNGVDVGAVSGVHLVRHGAEVTMTIRSGVLVPRDVVASVDIANDLGEQVIELTPRHGGDVAPLRSGATVPVARGGIPVEVGKVVASATRLLAAIPPGKLDKLLAEVAAALQGRAGDLRTIVAAGTSFSQQFLQYQAQVNALLANAPPVLTAVSAVGPQLRQALVNTEALVQVLATHKTDVDGDLSNGAAATGLLGTLVHSQAPDLACLIHDFSQLDANLDEPTNLSALSDSLALNQDFFGAVTGSTQFGTAKALQSGAASDPDQAMLRVRLLLPPAEPMGDAYASQVPIPAVKPGAACTTELGKGVGASSQPGFKPAAGGTLVAPTQAESVVRGAGDAQAQDTSVLVAHPDKEPSTLALPVLGGLFLPALVIAWCARPSRRRTRRRA